MQDLEVAQESRLLKLILVKLIYLIYKQKETPSCLIAVFRMYRSIDILQWLIPEKNKGAEDILF